MKKLLFALILIPFTIVAQSTNYNQGLDSDLSIKAINDLLSDWYKNQLSTSPCENGTYKIEVSDTLKIRNFRGAGLPAEVQSLLDNHGVNDFERKLASSLLSKTTGINFLETRVHLFKSSPEDQICTQFYFSPLLKTNSADTADKSNSTKYIIQYLRHSYGYVEEGLLLLTLEDEKFKIADHLLTYLVWD